MSRISFQPHIIRMWQREFKGYDTTAFRRDLLAGITTSAVALPLALAFGVASGADAAAGLVTAILAGIVIGALGGASFQISGPTGAMAAVLIILAQRYGLSGIWVASLLAGGFIFMLGIFRLGRFISFIPSPVIAGFTSGIALIIAIGQLSNVLGVAAPPADNALEQLLHYLSNPVMPDPHSLILAGIVMLTMMITPRFTRLIPGSLIGLVIAAPLAFFAGWDVATIGLIPRTILLEQHLNPAQIPWSQLRELLGPAVSIAALGAIESLLCGSVGSTMSGKPFDSNQELIAQGLGNMLIPFFGGVPATAAIARSSVAIKSGAVTRLTSIIHALGLLLSAVFLAPLIGRIPLAALGGVLLVTAWRMNEWETIRFFFRTRLKHALAGFLVTMLATVALDLTQAILIGIAISAVIYLRQSASSTVVDHEPVSIEKLHAQGFPITASCPSIHVYYLTGPLFFGSVSTVLQAFESAGDYHSLIISMRGVPLVDTMGIQAIRQITEDQRARGGNVVLTALQPAVLEMFQRTGLTDLIGVKHIYWSSVPAIIDLHEQRMVAGCPQCREHGEACAVFQQARERMTREADVAPINHTSE
jgi:SulP family sulfate permease